VIVRRTFGFASRLILLSLASTVALAQDDGPRACSENTGSIAGSVSDARGGGALPGASVVVEWDDLTMVHSTLRTSHHRARTAADNLGRFELCGLPSESQLSLRISADGFRDIESELALPANGRLTHAFRLADARAASGTGTVRARVVDDTGGVMTTGRATISALGRRATVDSGRIAIGGIPSGTWVVEVRAIGYERAVVLLETDPSDGPPTVRMDRAIHVLDPVSVVDKSTGADRKVLNEIALRMRVASGTLILASDLALRNATQAGEAVHSARGFSYKSATVYEARNQCRSTPQDTIRRRGRKEIAVYLDGVRMPAGLRSVNNLVPPGDILAIEAYPDVISAPFLWRTNDACAVIAFWTKSLKP
jgi:hypothetical protein